MEHPALKYVALRYGDGWKKTNREMSSFQALIYFGGVVNEVHVSRGLLHAADQMIWMSWARQENVAEDDLEVRHSSYCEDRLRDLAVCLSQALAMTL